MSKNIRFELDLGILDQSVKKLKDAEQELERIPGNITEKGRGEIVQNVILFTSDEIQKLKERIQELEKELDFRKEAINRYKENLPLSVEETAYIKNVSYQTVRNWYLKEGLPVNRMSKGSKIRIIPETLDKWLKAQNI